MIFKLPSFSRKKILDYPIPCDHIEEVDLNLVQEWVGLPNEREPGLITVQNERYLRPAGYKTDLSQIVIVGSSGSGKSTLVDSLRPMINGLHYPGNVEIFKRYITRPIRTAATQPRRENEPMIVEEMLRLAFYDKISFVWARILNNRPGHEFYAFPAPQSGVRLAILSGNNVLGEMVKKKSDALVIGIYCDDEERGNRLRARSGHEMPEAEMKKRLSDSTKTLLQGGEVAADILFDNTGNDMEKNQNAFGTMVQTIKQLRFVEEALEAYRCSLNV